MIQTKHALVFFVFLSVVLTGVVVYLVSTGKNVQDAVGNNEVTFAEGESDLDVLVSRSGRDESVRESLIAKLGEGGSSLKSEVDTPSREDTTVHVPPAGAVPIGDGKISTSPKIGYIYSCQQSFGGRGTFKDGPWIAGDYWYPGQKVSVDGGVVWSGSVSVTTTEGARLITANGLPNHTTGMFPIQSSDDAYAYDTNPNAISSQKILLQIPQFPATASYPSCLPLGMIGVGLNGVALYDGLDAMGRDAAAHEIQDTCDGHPDESGEYHYHGESECLVNAYYEGAESTLLGYALDGFGIYARLERGSAVTNSGLDACHGHMHTIPWDGSLIDMYHYHMTEEYPFSLGCFRGTPVDVASEKDVPPPPPGGSSPLPLLPPLKQQ